MLTCTRAVYCMHAYVIACMPIDSLRIYIYTFSQEN